MLASFHRLFAFFLRVFVLCRLWCEMFWILWRYVSRWMRKSFEDPFAILNTLAGGVLLKITHVNLIQFEHIGVEKKEQQIQSLLNFPCSKMFQSMVATSQGVSIKQQINWAEVLVGWDQPEKCFLAEFDKPEVWSNGGNRVMQDMYPFTYFDLYIYINIICHKFQEVPRGCANHFFSNNFTLSFLNFKYCPQDIGCCFESGNVTSENLIMGGTWSIFWNKIVDGIHFQPMIIGISICLCFLFRKI